MLNQQKEGISGSGSRRASGAGRGDGAALAGDADLVPGRLGAPWFFSDDCLPLLGLVWLADLVGSGQLRPAGRRAERAGVPTVGYRTPRRRARS